MEVKEAIKFLEELKTIIQDDDNNLNMTDYGYKKMDMTIDLLKSLKDENKALKILRQAQKDEDKKEGIRYQTMYRLKKENKKLKSYKVMWKSMRGYLFNFHKESINAGIYDTQRAMEKIEQKYLGGGE